MRRKWNKIIRWCPRIILIGSWIGLECNPNVLMSVLRYISSDYNSSWHEIGLIMQQFMNRYKGRNSLVTKRLPCQDAVGSQKWGHGAEPCGIVLNFTPCWLYYGVESDLWWEWGIATEHRGRRPLGHSAPEGDYLSCAHRNQFVKDEARISCIIVNLSKLVPPFKGK